MAGLSRRKLLDHLKVAEGDADYCERRLRQRIAVSILSKMLTENFRDEQLAIEDMLFKCIDFVANVHSAESIKLVA